MAFELLFASALNSNTARVYFNEQPRHVSPLGSTDSLNRDLWQIQLVTAGDPKVVEPEIGAVENAQFAGDFLVASGISEPSAWSVDLRTARRLANERSVFRVVASTDLENDDGSSTLDPAHDRDDFPGVVSVRPREPARPARELQDRPDLHYDFFAGTYRLDQASDIGLHSGDDALKKRIIRRILTVPGQFRHLETYGVGVEVKKRFTATRLAELRVAAIKQVKQEAEVGSVAVDASFSGGVLILTVAVGTRRGRLTFSVEQDGEGAPIVV
jgi:hypothetical protein